MCYTTKTLGSAKSGLQKGGWFEVALGCHYRIAADHAILGLPELKLGLLESIGSFNNRCVGFAFVHYNYSFMTQ
ncbi:hypothetical protein JNUCC42_19980 [Brevibacterium sp. JNUCC-42]|nr:hypothetical protein JNUCC42_19980 [Brevibacterium sp. JNUCC-42]